MKEYNSIKVYGSNLPAPWYAADNPFEENFKNQEEYAITHILPNKEKVKYQFDNHGFRKSNTLESSRLWFFGCSQTFGEALDYNSCFAKIVSEEINQPFYNFGTVGGNINLIARLLFKLKNQLTDKKIIIFLPSSARFETKIKDIFLGLHPNHKNYKDFIPINNLDGFLEYNILQSTMLIKSILSNNNALIMTTYESNVIKNLNPINIKNILVDLAADGLHYGTETNKNIANLIVNHIKS